MARELPIRNGRLTTDLDADGHKIKNLPPGEGFTQAQADWKQSDSTKPDFIKNKPTIPAPVTIDSALSTTSTNPVQNKVVKEALDGKLSKAEAADGFTTWIVKRDGVDVTAQVAQPSYDSAENAWYVGASALQSDTSDTYYGVSQDATELTWNATDGVSGIVYAATRVRLPTMADLACKANTNDVQLTPVYGGDKFSIWTVLRDGVDVTSQVIQPVWDPTESKWSVIASVIPGETVSGSISGSADSMSLTWSSDSSETLLPVATYTATRTENPIIGYTLGSQTAKPLAPTDDLKFAPVYSSAATYAAGALCVHGGQLYRCNTLISSAEAWNSSHWTLTDVKTELARKYEKPQGGIPKADLTSGVQTSLGLADTAVQPAGIAGLMPMYALGATPTVAESVSVLAACFPIVYNDGLGGIITISASDADNLSVDWNSEGQWFYVAYNGSGLFYANEDGTFDDVDGLAGQSITFNGETPTQDTTPVLNIKNILTVSPYTVATYTATSTQAAFEIAVGALPTGVTGKARDCILVIDCTATGAVAPTVTWDTHVHPRTDVATDLAIVEAGKRAVFYISEYAAGEFVVGGWVETEGGSGT